MRLKTRNIGLLASLAMIFGGVLGASPAHAIALTADCSTVGAPQVTNTLGIFVGATSTVQNVGSGVCNVTFTGTSGVVTWVSSSGSDTPSANPTTLAAGATMTFTGAVAGSETVILANNRTYNYVFTVTNGGGGGGGGGGSPSGSSSAATGPAPVFQQFGKPATGTCADAAAATLNWAGVASGGWGESWAQWMNGGKGGAVCNRALIYSLGLSKWVVNA